MQLYEDICRQNVEDYGKKHKNWTSILVNQYSDRTHFIFELLQNAEDAKADCIHVRLFRDRLEFEHNGRLFDGKDIRSVCGVGDSTKKDTGGIGKFGIGFKSVYAYTNTPRIYSGLYAFEINDLILPKECERIPLDKKRTLIVLPFNNHIDKAYDEIKTALLKHLKSESILILNSIEEVNIKIESYTEEIQLLRQERELNEKVSEVEITTTRKNLQGHTEKERVDRYLMFSNSAEYPVIIAYALNDKKEILEVPNTNLYAHFPTAIESHQNFYIHAPFNTTPARDNIVNDSTNKKFIKNICEVINYSFQWMRDNGFLSLRVLSKVYPVYQYETESLYYPIYENSISFLKSGEAILPLNDSSRYKKLDEVIIPASMNIVECFDDEALQRLTGNHRYYWMSKDITISAHQPFKKFLDDNFSIKTFEWKDLVTRVTADFLEVKPDQWLIKLFDNISGLCEKSYAHNTGRYIDAKELPLVRLQNGKHMKAHNGIRPNVYLNNPSDCPNIIRKSLLDDEGALAFYRNALFIPEYNALREVIDVILPKYKSKQEINLKTETILDENIEDLKVIKTAIYTDAAKVMELLKGKPILTDGKEWFYPSELYIPESFCENAIPEYRLLKSVAPMKFVSEHYLKEKRIDGDFLEKIGCLKTLNTIRLEKAVYLDLVSKYMGSEERHKIATCIFNKKYQEGFEWDKTIEYIPEILSRIDLVSSYLLARFLNRNYAKYKIKGEMFGANDQNHSGVSAESHIMFSALGLYLSYVPWIYNKNGIKCVVSELYRKDLDQRYEKEAKSLIDNLPFKEEDNIITQVLEQFQGKEREYIKEFLTNAEKRKEIITAFDKIHAIEERERNKAQMSPKEALEAQASKQQGKMDSNVNKGFDQVEVIKDKESRKERLEKTFEASMDYVTAVNRYLKYTCHDVVSKEEKAFLKYHYSGKCQICDKLIPKYTGENHFVAINVIKTNFLAPKFKSAIEEGWNSLCLCPNCAAEYQYGTKNMDSFYQQVMDKDVIEYSDEYIKIRISLQDKERYIKYVPKHFQALKTAMEFYSNCSD